MGLWLDDPEVEIIEYWMTQVLQTLTLQTFFEPLVLDSPIPFIASSRDKVC